MWCVLWLPWKPLQLLLPVKGPYNWVPPFILLTVVSPHHDLQVFLTSNRAGVSLPDGFKAFQTHCKAGVSGWGYL